MQCVNCGCEAEVLDSGVLINRQASMSSELIRLGTQLLELEKMTKRTPPKTMVAEWRRVHEAKGHVALLKETIAKLEAKFKQNA